MVVSSNGRKRGFHPRNMGSIPVTATNRHAQRKFLVLICKQSAYFVSSSYLNSIMVVSQTLNLSGLGSSPS